MLSVLHGDGVLEIWDIATDLTPPSSSNRGKDYKVASPIRIWRGPFASRSGLQPRQVVMWKPPRGLPSSDKEVKWAVAVLASASVFTEDGDIDNAIYVKYDDGANSTVTLPASPGTGKLIVSMGHLWFQSKSGELLEGTSRFLWGWNVQ
jgi:hypothetical protein